MAIVLGQSLGPYKLVRLLDQGGYAEVYEGEHIYIGTHVAVKVLKNTIVTDEDIKKFKDEARIIAQLVHPNIIRILHFDIQDGTPYLVMDYAQNGTLQDSPPKNGAPHITVVSYIKQVAEALQFAHDHGVIHRDVKPANMLKLNDGRIALSDFGIAIIAQSGPQDAVGTPYYMAPEQILGHPKPASDQYALGIVAYQWLSGDLPFKGQKQEIPLQHLNAPPPRLNGKVPPEIEQIIFRALAKDPEQRFPSVKDFADALENAYRRISQEVQSVTQPIPLTLPALSVSAGGSDSTTAFFSVPAFQPTASAGTLISRYDDLLRQYHVLNVRYNTDKQAVEQQFNAEKAKIEADIQQQENQAISRVRRFREDVSKAMDSLRSSQWNYVINSTPTPSIQAPFSLDSMTASQKDASDASRTLISLIARYNNRSSGYPRAMIIIGVLALGSAGLYGLYALLAWALQIFSVHWAYLDAKTLTGFVFTVLFFLLLVGSFWLIDRTRTTRAIKENYVRLKQADDAFNAISPRQKEARENTLQERLIDSYARTSQKREKIERKFRKDQAQLNPRLAQFKQEDGLLVAGWDDARWPRWQPPQHVIPLARLGVMQESGNFPPIPALTICPGLDNVLFKATGPAKEIAVQALQSLMLRLLTSQFPGKLRFTLIDPTGLGHNVETFLQLADYDDQLISRTVWTERGEIARQLDELSRHMKNVVQQNLRNQFETIEEYNRIAGEIAEPYRILVVVGFPIGFNKETANQLTGIAATGPRCGVSILMTVDTEQPLPPGFKLAELERLSKVIVSNDQEFVWQYKDIGSFKLLLDSLPKRDILDQLLKRVGEKALQARQRVEIPLRWAIERQVISEYRWWASDQNTIEEVATPLGRIGADKCQYLRLGKLTAHHALIVGMTGTGKTNLLHVLIIGLSLIYTPDELEFYLIDFKRVGFTQYARYKLPHARVVAIQSEREFGLRVMEGLKEELERREQLFSKAGIQDFTSFRRSQPRTRLPRILLVVDEFQELFMQQDDIARQAAEHLERFVRMGRELGIHIILSSQTLAGLALPGGSTIHGRPTILNESTINQMPVRIALKSKGTDSHLILSENNTASSLLLQFRQGEAIYNAESGAETGNNRFQAFWLASEELRLYLDAIRLLAQSHNYVSERPQVIFDGSRNVDINENQALNLLLRTSSRPMQQFPTIWFGNPIALNDATNIQMRPGRSHNLLIMSQDENVSVGLLTIALFTLAVQHSSKSAHFYMLDGRSDTPYVDRLRQREQKFPHTIKTANRRTLSSFLTEISDEIKDREERNTEQKSSIYVFINGLHRINDFFPRETASSTLTKQLLTILRDGPEQGVHTLVWCDQLNNLNRMMEGNILDEFGQRIVSQMSEHDSSRLIGSKEASKLGLYRALLFNEGMGTLEKFIPYEPPSDEWQEQALDRLHHKS